MKEIMRIRTNDIRSLKDIKLEKARLRYQLLHTQLELTSQFQKTREMFSFRNLRQAAQRTLLGYLSNALTKFIR